MNTRPALRFANARPDRRPRPIAVGLAVSLLLHLALGGWMAARPSEPRRQATAAKLKVRVLAPRMAQAAVAALPASAKPPHTAPARTARAETMKPRSSHSPARHEPARHKAPVVALATPPVHEPAVAESPAPVTGGLAFGLPQFASPMPSPARAWPRPSPPISGVSPTAAAARSLMPSVLGPDVAQAIAQRRAWDAQDVLQQQLFAALENLRRQWPTPPSALSDAACHLGPNTECANAALRDALAAHTAELSAWLDALRRIDPRAQALAIAVRDGEYRVSVLQAM